MTGVKHFLLTIAVVALVGCGKKEATEPQAKAQATPKAEPKVDTAPKTEPKAEARKPNELVAWVSDPNDPNNVKIEAAIRKQINKPTGELTKVDLEKVKELYLGDNQLTDVKGLEKLTQLRVLGLVYNLDLTKAQIEELQKALPKCKINHNAKK